MIRRGPSALPTIKLNNNTAVQAALGLQIIGSAQADFSRGKRFEVQFTDVEFTAASILNVRNAVRSDTPECARLKPLLQVNPVSIRGTLAPPMLASTVIYAKRTARLYTETSGDAQAQADALKKLIQGVNITAQVKVVVGEQNTVELDTASRVPVAYVPAYTIAVLPTAAAGISIEPLDPNSQASIDAFTQWLLTSNRLSGTAIIVALLEFLGAGAGEAAMCVHRSELDVNHTPNWPNGESQKPSLSRPLT